MIKKLVKHGNSYALIIDKPILELLNITPDTELEVTTDGIQLFVRPVAKGNKEDTSEVQLIINKRIEQAS